MHKLVSSYTYIFSKSILNSQIYIFLSYVSFVFNTLHSPHDYSTIHFSLKMPTLDLHCIDAGVSFISFLISGTVNASELLASISLRVPTYPTRDHYFFIFHLV